MGTLRTKRAILAAALCPAAFASGWHARTASVPDELQDLLDAVELVDVPDGANGTASTLLVRDVDLQVVNGLGATATADGTGNVIVGWAESAGPTDRTGSHNLVVGARHSWTGWGGLAAGDRALVANHASAVAGSAHLANGDYAAVVGGLRLSAPSPDAAALGGRRNTASAGAACALGGGSEAGGSNASGPFALVAGGRGSTAGGDAAAAAGGVGSAAPAREALALGGDANAASGTTSAVLGGTGRTAGDGEVLGDGQTGDDGDWTVGAGTLASATARVGVGEPAPAFALDAADPPVKDPAAVLDAGGDLVLGAEGDSSHFALHSGTGDWLVGAAEGPEGETFAVELAGAERFLAIAADGSAALGAEVAAGALHLARAAGLRLLVQAPFADQGLGSLELRGDGSDPGRVGFLSSGDSYAYLAAGGATLRLDPYQALAQVSRNLAVRGAAVFQRGLSVGLGAAMGPTTAGVAGASEYPIEIPEVPFRIFAWGVVDVDGNRVAGSPNWRTAYDSGNLELTFDGFTSELPQNIWFLYTVNDDIDSSVDFLNWIGSGWPSVAPHEIHVAFDNSPSALLDVPHAFSFVCLQAEW